MAPDPIPNGGKQRNKRSSGWHGPMEVEMVEENNHAEDHRQNYDVWLIRKPIDVPLDEIKKRLVLPTSRKPICYEQKISFRCDSNDVTASTIKGDGRTPQQQETTMTRRKKLKFECRVEVPPRKQMLHLDVSRANTAKELCALRPDKEIKGIAFIGHLAQLADGGVLPPEDDYLNSLPSEPIDE